MKNLNPNLDWDSKVEFTIGGRTFLAVPVKNSCEAKDTFEGAADKEDFAFLKNHLQEFPSNLKGFRLFTNRRHLLSLTWFEFDQKGESNLGEPEWLVGIDRIDAINPENDMVLFSKEHLEEDGPCSSPTESSTEATAEEKNDKETAWLQKEFPQGLIGRRIRVTVMASEQEAESQKSLNPFSTMISESKIGSFALFIAANNCVSVMLRPEPAIPFAHDQEIKAFSLSSDKAKGDRWPIESQVLVSNRPTTLNGWLEFID
ncbi:MAG: hypothetical protein WCT37_02575 [Patescibacteria group bacterium]|jgi:hypothetical protein